MCARIVMASSHVDRHGDRIAKEALKDGVDKLNGQKKLKWTVNHRRDFPPIGIIEKAELIEQDNNCYLTAETSKYPHRSDIEWDNTLLTEYFDVPVIFKDIEDMPVDAFTISLDKNDFASYQDFELLSGEVHKLMQGEVVCGMHARKSAINDPEVVITISKYSLIYLLLHPFVKKIGEKLAEDSYDVAKKQLKHFKVNLFKTLKTIHGRIKHKEKTLVTIFEIPGVPYVELFAKTNDIDLVIRSITENKLQAIKKVIDSIGYKVEISKMQFVLNEKGKWTFNYLITTNGQSIGKKSTFKKRDELYNRILLNNTQVTG